MREKITLTLQHAEKLRKVSALSGKTCGDIVDQALEDFFLQLSSEDDSESHQDMVEAMKVAGTLRRKVAIQGNSTVLDSLRSQGGVCKK